MEKQNIEKCETIELSKTSQYPVQVEKTDRYEETNEETLGNNAKFNLAINITKNK